MTEAAVVAVEDELATVCGGGGTWKGGAIIDGHACAMVCAIGTLPPGGGGGGGMAQFGTWLVVAVHAGGGIVFGIIWGVGNVIGGAAMARCCIGRSNR